MIYNFDFRKSLGQNFLIDDNIVDNIANAIDLIVQIDRLSDGKRKITSISEIDGMKDGEIVLKEIFSFKQVGVANDGSVMGEFGVYKRKPRVYDKITRKGIDIKDIFN